MSDGITITCACGLTDDIGKFCRTVTGELPVGSYQCPSCKRAWRIEKTPIHIVAGRVHSQPNKIIPQQASL